MTSLCNVLCDKMKQKAAVRGMDLQSAGGEIIFAALDGIGDQQRVHLWMLRAWLSKE